MRPLLFSIIALLVFTSFKPKRPKLPKEFGYVPSGTYTRHTDSARVSIEGFFISKYEISNLQYREFYYAVAPALSENERRLIACDSTGWEMGSSYTEPLKKFYFSHPSFNQYPVVNVSYEGALAYCKWLEEKIRKDNPDYDISVRIPTKEQWVWAAMGGRSNAMFPWGTYYLRNKKGEYLCNFRTIPEHAIHRNKSTGKPEIYENVKGVSDRAVYTSGINSFWPNDYGLYNMCGNVAEMVAEKGIAMGGSWNDYGGDVHIRAETNFDKPSPTVGFRPIVIVKGK